MTFPARVVLATRNGKKLQELQRLLESLGITSEVLSLESFPDFTDDIAETAPDFEGNALIKATAVAAATGLPAIADDSGLCVDALNGMPGVLSARWSVQRDDHSNLELVLAQTADVPAERRGAAFVAAVAYVDGEGEPIVVRGQMRGHLLTQPRGSHGFGYDPIFQPVGYESSNAELSPQDKDAISHRGQALRALVEQLAQRAD